MFGLVYPTVPDVFKFSVGQETFIVKGSFTHDFYIGSFYEVFGKLKIAGVKKEIYIEQYTLSYPTEKQDIYSLLTNLCATHQLVNALMDQKKSCSRTPCCVISKVREFLRN